MMKRILTALFISAVFSAAASAQEIVSSRTEKMSLKSYRAFCEGVVPKKCLVVKREGEEEFRTMFDEIENFDFVPGYEYELRVQVDKLAAAPKDTSGFRYYLREIVRRKQIQGSEQSIYLFGNKWVLLAIEGEAVSESHAFVVLAGHNSAVYGNTGCNSFSGTFEISGNSFRLSPLAMTKRACFDPQVREDAFVGALAKADEILVEPDRLYLKAGGKVVLEFKPVL